MVSRSSQYQCLLWAPNVHCSEWCVRPLFHFLDDVSYLQSVQFYYPEFYVTLMSTDKLREGGNSYIEITAIPSLPRSLEKRSKKPTGHVRHFFTMAKREREKARPFFRLREREKASVVTQRLS